MVRFAASDGTHLVGAVWGRGRRGVVLAHGRPADLCMWVPYARRLAAGGYRVLAFDFRGAGLSAVPHYPRSNRLDLDVQAAAGALGRSGATRTVVIGTSYGGPASFVAGARLYPAVGGVVGLSSIDSSTILDAAAAVAGSKVPVLLLAATGDDDIPRYSRAIYRAAKTTDKKRVIVPGYEHSVALFSGPRGPQVLAAIDAFLRSHTA